MSINTPPVVEKDAKNRAWRTFLQGLLFDVGFATVLVLHTALSTEDFAWDKANFVLLVGTVGKTAAVTAISYLMRKFSPPPPELTPRANITHDV